MTYYELSFKLQHDCPYNSFSKKYPGVIISHWCNWSRDVLEIVHNNLDDGNINRAIKELLHEIGSKIIQNPRPSSNQHLILQHCSCDSLPPPTLPTIEKHNCLNLQPMIYTGGWETYRVMAFSDRDIKNLFKELEKDCQVEVTMRRSISEESVHNSLLVSTGSLVSGLTDKQASALVTALDYGYYNLPRNMTAGEIARKLHMPRTSFVDHLRKAENKLIQSVGSYVRLQTTTQPPKTSRTDT